MQCDLSISKFEAFHHRNCTHPTPQRGKINNIGQRPMQTA